MILFAVYFASQSNCPAERLPMDLDHAVNQIDAIWQQVSHSSTFRGYRARTVAATGVLGIGAALAQSIWLPDPANHIDAYLWLWVSVASLSSLGVLMELSLRYYRTTSRLER